MSKTEIVTPETHSKIGKVTLRGGAELVRLDLPVKDEAQKNLVNYAGQISGFFRKDELKGFVVIGWGADGAPSIGFQLHPDGPVSETMLPSVVADALRRKLISSGSWENG